MSPVNEIKFDFPDADVLRTVRDKANSTVGETYKRLKQRIDKLGVVQPNVSLDASRDLILVELPGIDNPELAREVLVRAAKLESWDTYRLGDNNIQQSLIAADTKLKNLLSADSSAQETTSQMDTVYAYPTDPATGLPDSTQAAGNAIDAKSAKQHRGRSWPLSLAFNMQGGGAALGYADKNKRKAISERPGPSGYQTPGSPLI